MSSRVSRISPRTVYVTLGYLAFTIFVIFPIIWVFMMSLKEFRDIIAYPPKFIFTPTLKNYAAILFGSETAGLTTGISDYVKLFKKFHHYLWWSSVALYYYWLAGRI